MANPKIRYTETKDYHTGYMLIYVDMDLDGNPHGIRVTAKEHSPKEWMIHSVFGPYDEQTNNSYYREAFANSHFKGTKTEAKNHIQKLVNKAYRELQLV